MWDAELFFCCFFFWLHHAAHKILVPQPGIKPSPPVMEAWVLTTGWTRKFQDAVLDWASEAFLCQHNKIHLQGPVCQENHQAIPGKVIDV